jgi:hypothetical protein
VYFDVGDFWLPLPLLATSSSNLKPHHATLSETSLAVLHSCAVND